MYEDLQTDTNHLKGLHVSQCYIIQTMRLKLCVAQNTFFFIYNAEVSFLIVNSGFAIICRHLYRPTVRIYCNNTLTRGYPYKSFP